MQTFPQVTAIEYTAPSQQPGFSGVVNELHGALLMRYGGHNLHTALMNDTTHVHEDVRC